MLINYYANFMSALINYYQALIFIDCIFTLNNFIKTMLIMLLLLVIINIVIARLVL